MTSDTFTANPLKAASSSEAAAAASSLKIQRSRRRRMLTRLGCLIGLVILFAALYQFAFVNPKFFSYAMSIRLPRLIVLLTAGTAISAAAIIFQTIIRNNIVTPCLLGMNSLYLLIHTGVVFFLGSGSEFATNPVYAFAVDIIVMGTAASFIYYSIFQKTGGNVLYVLLIGTVLTTFFSSMQNSLTRIMDPNEYDALLNSLVASFTNVNAACIIPGIVLLALLAWWLRRDLSILDVISLGREQAISRLRNDAAPSDGGGCALYRRCNGSGGTALLSGPHHSQCRAADVHHLPPHLPDCRSLPRRHARARRRAVHC